MKQTLLAMGLSLLFLVNANAQWNSTRSSAWWTQAEASLENVLGTTIQDSSLTLLVIGANGDTIGIRGQFQFWRNGRYVPQDSLYTIEQIAAGYQPLDTDLNSPDIPLAEISDTLLLYVKSSDMDIPATEISDTLLLYVKTTDINTAGKLETVANLGAYASDMLVADDKYEAQIIIMPTDPGADRFLMWDDSETGAEVVWGTPAGSGDMTQAVYDVDSDSKADVDTTDVLGLARTAAWQSKDSSLVSGTANNQWMHYDLGNGWTALAGADVPDSLGFSANGESLVKAADYAAMRTLLSLVVGTNVQAYDADLTTYAGITPSANIQTFLGSADFSAMRTNLSLVVGTNVQAYDADLTTYAGITPSANVQSLLGAADYAAMRGLLDLEAGTDFYSITATDELLDNKADTLAYHWGVMDTVTVGDLVAYKVESNITVVKVSAYGTADSVLFNIQERAAGTPTTAGDSLFASPMWANSTGKDSTSFTGAGGANFAKNTWIMPVVTTGLDATRFGVTVWYIKQDY